MEKLSSGLTWDQIQELFDADAEFDLILNYRQRRASPQKRKKGEAEERKVWRLTVQKDHKNFVRTIFKKNLKDAPEALGSEVANNEIVNQINRVIA